MTMVAGWVKPVPDRPSKTFIPFGRRDARCAYAFCLIASILSIFILAYVTSFKHLQFGRKFFPESKHAGPNGSGSAVNSIQIVGLVNKNGDHIRLDSIMGYSPKGVLELRWTKNGTDSRIMTPPTSNSNSSGGGEARLNCTGVNMTSDILSMVPYKFLPNFKNPCWYEPLVTPDVYSTNKYKSFSRFAKSMFKDLKEEWNTRLEETPEPKRLRCLPYFFIAGQPKCGSTDFYIKLTSHPDVISPPMKEPHWWAKNRYGWRYNFSAPVPIHQYIDLFDRAALFIEHVNDPNSAEEEQEAYHQLITGDSSVSTLWFNDYWWRAGENCGNTEPKYTNAHYIRYLLPHSRIIVILRNPVDRLYSDYLYFRKKGKSPDVFHREVYLAINSFNRCLNVSTMRACIYNRTIASFSKVRLRIGIYYVFIQEWLRLFPKQQLLVFRLENYAQDPLDILKNAFKFLGLRSLTSDEEDKIFQQPTIANARRKKDKDLGVMRDDTRKMLEEFYRPYNQKLSILLHDTQYLWRNN